MGWGIVPQDEEFYRTVDNALAFGFVALAGSSLIALTMGIFLLFSKDYVEPWDLFKKAADLNQNGEISHYEWNQVYRELHLSYNPYTSDPRKDISEFHMSRYVEDHR